MKFEKGNTKLGFPEHFRFGIEIEVNNVNKEKLYHSAESQKFLKSIGYETREDMTVDAECVSGILDDSEQTWENLKKMCEHIKKYPDENGRQPVAGEKSGCHVHFDATELLQNSKMMENLDHLWVDCEELIYKMCNAENNPIRRNAVKQELIPSIDLRGNLLSVRTLKEIAKFPIKLYNNAIHVFIERRKGYASPSGQKILDAINKNKLKVSYKKWGKFKKIINRFGVPNPKRYQGLNKTNIGNEKKNTIEFRMSNGSIDPEIIKQNVFLYGSFLKSVREMTLNPDYKKEEIALLKKTDCTEGQKVDRLLNVFFDNEGDKRIYKDRWQSVKDAPVFLDTRFAKNCFVREDIKQIAEKTPWSKLQNAMIAIKQMLPIKEENKEYMGYDK